MPRASTWVAGGLFVVGACGPPGTQRPVVAPAATPGAAFDRPPTVAVPARPPSQDFRCGSERCGATEVCCRGRAKEEPASRYGCVDMGPEFTRMAGSPSEIQALAEGYGPRAEQLCQQTYGDSWAWVDAGPQACRGLGDCGASKKCCTMPAGKTTLSLCVPMTVDCATEDEVCRHGEACSTEGTECHYGSCLESTLRK